MKASVALLALCALGGVSTAQAKVLKIAPDNEKILYMGRTHVSDSGTVDFNYPGVTAMMNFTGEKLTMKAKPGSKFFMVEIDGLRPFKVNFSDSVSEIVLADSLAQGPHSARITYAIEGHELRPSLWGFEISGKKAKLLNAPERPKLKIEFIGNSLTCGYGTEADSPQIHFSHDNENHTLAYSYLVARSLDADFNMVAKSGIGVYRSYGGPIEGTPGNCMPDLYDGTFFYTSEHPWDHNSFHPDIICINLGTNDTSLEQFDVDLFEAKYNKFLDHLRQLHPNAIIAVLNGPMLSGKWLDIVTGALDRAAAGRKDVYRFNFTPYLGEMGYGADYHPSKGENERMARELLPFMYKLIFENGLYGK